MAALTAEGFANFFTYYKGTPAQSQGVEILRQLIAEADPSLLETEAAWVRQYRARPPRPPSARLNVPYQSQLDNEIGPHRTCFSSSVAMAVMFHLPEQFRSDEDYISIRQRFGDSTDPIAHLHAVRSIGLSCEYSQGMSSEDLEDLIDEGVPVPCGWLHRGPLSAPSGGHWSTCIGYDQQSFVHHDPYGVCDQTRGVYGAEDGSNIHYSRSRWANQRWQVEGPGTGWAMIIRP